MALTALILGFAGSMHCLGMCSPLVLAVTNMTPYAILNRTIYNAGRITTYGILGALVAGAGMITTLSRYQGILSIALGMTLLISGFLGVSSFRIPAVTTLMHKVTSKIKLVFGRRLTQKNRGSMFVLGMLNGLLPCGLTLIALTWCITLKGPVDGLGFMLMFGAGTLPVMLGFTAALPALVKKLNLSIRKLTTTMLILSGLLLILRVFITHHPHTDSGGIIEIMMCR